MTKVEPGRGSKFWNSRVHCQLQKTFKPVANSGLFEFATVLCFLYLPGIFSLLSVNFPHVCMPHAVCIPLNMYELCL